MANTGLQDVNNGKNSFYLESSEILTLANTGLQNYLGLSNLIHSVSNSMNCDSEMARTTLHRGLTLANAGLLDIDNGKHQVTKIT